MAGEEGQLYGKVLFFLDGKVLFFLALNLPILSSSSTRKTTGLDKEGRHGTVDRVYPVSKFLFWWLLGRFNPNPYLHPSHWFFFALFESNCPSPRIKNMAMVSFALSLHP